MVKWFGYREKNSVLSINFHFVVKTHLAYKLALILWNVHFVRDVFRSSLSYESSVVLLSEISRMPWNKDNPFPFTNQNFCRYSVLFPLQTHLFACHSIYIRKSAARNSVYQKHLCWINTPRCISLYQVSKYVTELSNLLSQLFARALTSPINSREVLDS